VLATHVSGNWRNVKELAPPDFLARRNRHVPDVFLAAESLERVFARLILMRAKPVLELNAIVLLVAQAREGLDSVRGGLYKERWGAELFFWATYPG
jgi:hypothetical protein